MENRALLAFVLSLAVFMLWGYLLAWLEGPQLEKGELQVKSDQKKVLKKKNPPSGRLPKQSLPRKMPDPTSAEPLPTQPVFTCKEVKVLVDTGLTTTVLSNRGGVVEHVYMNRFFEKEEPIDLVQSEEGANPPLILVSNNDAITHILQNAFYETSTETIELSPEHPEDKLTLTLKHESGLEVVREFTFHFNQYLIDVNTRITAPAFADRNLTYAVLWGPGLGGTVVSHTDHFIFAGPTTFLNNERVETPLEEIQGRVSHKGELGWTGFQNKYFAVALIPQEGIAYGITEMINDQVYAGLQFQTVQSAASSNYRLYIGTKELLVLEEAGHKLIRLMDYGWVGNKFAFLVKPLLKGLQYFYSITGNYGWAIIFTTIIVKILFFPLTHKSFKSMKGLQKIQPYVKVIQERNKDDRQKMNEELIDLYRKHKVNPMGGCLPMLLQIPVFIALYHVLFFSIELRGAPFIGWITDLSEADPYYVTPVLMGMSMFLQQKMTPTVGDPMQQKIMMLLPIFFTFLFVTFPAGLVIYWTVNNLLTITQQYYIYKMAKD